MSMLHRTDAYQRQSEKADRKHSGYGFILALICVALALVVASVMFTPAPVGIGIGKEIKPRPCDGESDSSFQLRPSSGWPFFFTCDRSSTFVGP